MCIALSSGSVSEASAGGVDVGVSRVGASMGTGVAFWASLAKDRFATAGARDWCDFFFSSAGPCVGSPVVTGVDSLSGLGGDVLTADGVADRFAGMMDDSHSPSPCKSS